MTQIQGNTVLQAGPCHAGGPRLREGRSAPCATRGQARAPLEPFMQDWGVSAVKKAWPSLEGGMEVDKALPGRSPRPSHRPHSPPPSPLRWDPGP